MVIGSGNYQTAPVTSKLPLPLKVKVKDAHGNGVAGVSVAFTDGGAGGTLSPTMATTDSSGIATTSYTIGTKAGTVHITASVAGLTSVIFHEAALAGPAVSLTIFAGNNQTVKAGTLAAKPLQVFAGDQYGNGVHGVSVSFSDGGAGGSFAPDPVVTTTTGTAGTHYTAPVQKGTVTVTASAPGLSSVFFTLNVD